MWMMMMMMKDIDELMMSYARGWTASRCVFFFEIGVTRLPSEEVSAGGTVAFTSSYQEEEEEGRKGGEREHAHVAHFTVQLYFRFVVFVRKEIAQRLVQIFQANWLHLASGRGW
ncbi:hypothetical protein T07_13465 [Trichinella nelsoni]|uniref:Uncharacterized protein n=1 Tax=Trichinella nelsoni TaxID=6336 RepID=A0A0V0SIC5_9BILA|nr:hypothetical protein T07_13465 [Trichinella nelsoni]